MKDIHEPIDITVDARVRAIMRSRYAEECKGEPFEVADIQTVIKAMSCYVNVLRHRVLDAEKKCKRQKNKLSEYEKTIKEQRKFIAELKLSEKIEFGKVKKQKP
ncbi:MAG TPA: hypothetical protein ENH82_04875 [bacterium]|nr:hypothetical protein [bacterium]